MRRLLAPLYMSCLLSAPAWCAETASGHKARPGPEQTAELTDTIRSLDQKLFAAVFDDCDTDVLKTLVDDDFEFFHDKDGQSADSGAQFIASISGMCERQRAGTDYRARRELDRASLGVFPMNHYGAVETGVHRFYMLEPGKPEKLVEISRFTMLWRHLEDGSWRLSRVISYDHDTTP
jgi:hypothetical protein